MNTAFRALRHRDFRLFFFGTLFSNVGTWMQSVAQGWLVQELTRDPRWLGTISFLGTLPGLLLAPLSGVAADRLDRRRLMLTTQTVMMLCALLQGVLTLSGHIKIAHLCILTFVSGCALAVNGPSFSATIKDLVGKDDIPSGVGMISSQFHLSRALGPLLSSVLIPMLGLGACFVANAASFLAVIVALLAISSIQKPAPARVGSQVTSAIREALSYVATEPVTRWLLLCTAGTSFLGMVIVTLMPHIVRDVFHRNEVHFGYIMSASGAGALVGALLSATVGPRLGYRRATGLGASLFGLGLCLFAYLAGRGQFLLAIPVVLMIGLSQVLTSALGMATVQASVPDALRGRVMSLYNLAFVGSMTLSGLTAGWAAHLISALWTVGIAGMLLCLLTLVAQILAPKPPSEAGNQATS